MPKKKTALLFVCLNQPYWPYLNQVFKDAKRFFLTNHDVDIYAWTDVTQERIDARVNEFCTHIDQVANISEPVDNKVAYLIGIFERIIKEFSNTKQELLNDKIKYLYDTEGISMRFNEEGKLLFDFRNERTEVTVTALSKVEKELIQTFYADWSDLLATAHIMPTEPAEWPYPTLMRYHLFLQQEEKLREYDYLFYLDADMKIVDEVKEEILSDGLTMAEHPMYSLKKRFVPPYEPNRKSTAYIPRLGCVLSDEFGRPYFKPLYAAGGFQGGKSSSFIQAMKAMKESIDKDFINNYIAIWNDESHWNKYLYTYTGLLTVLSPSYVYPDSLIEQYYHKIWEKPYKPIIYTLTKPFSLSKEGGEALKETLKTI